jgi:hypothetical protein
VPKGERGEGGLKPAARGQRPRAETRAAAPQGGSAMAEAFAKLRSHG